eukprot:55468-Eustigmatos_ZCMA.PRE.1
MYKWRCDARNGVETVRQRPSKQPEYCVVPVTTRLRRITFKPFLDGDPFYMLHISTVGRPQANMEDYLARS